MDSKQEVPRIKKNLLGISAISILLAAQCSLAAETSILKLYKHTGFLRFSFDNLSMPKNIPDMGLMGVTYYGDLTDYLYGGVGGYGSVSGTQGGLFVLGVGLGLHAQFANHWWADAGAFVGGGGGRSSLVGGGLMVKPYVGIAYDWRGARFGLHYSYIDFTSGLIHSSQIGLDLDIPIDFYYADYKDIFDCNYITDIQLLDGKFLAFQRNDFSILLQAYFQKNGTKNVLGKVQDGTIGTVGAELDHYMTEKWFWWAKASGAYSGGPNGYMDVLGGIGYRQPITQNGVALVPQFGLGAGGGGNVDTGGGVLVTPQLGIEVPLTKSFAARMSAGYLWAPDGEFKAVSATGMLIYHLNLPTGSCEQCYETFNFATEGWRVHIFNQTYLYPQRTFTNNRPPINMVALQIDQIFSPYFFFSYQAASAYAGDHAGGYATGMIGPGIQTPIAYNPKMQLFGEVLIGAGGGGSLSLGGGAIVEPVVGLHYYLTSVWGLTASVGQLKAINHDLNTTIVNLGLTFRFATVNKTA